MSLFLTHAMGSYRLDVNVEFLIPHSHRECKLNSQSNAEQPAMPPHIYLQVTVRLTRGVTTRFATRFANDSLMVRCCFHKCFLV